MTLEKRMKELIAIGASVGANCRSCLRFHGREALESGASAEEVAAAIAVGQEVRRGAAANLDQSIALLHGDPCAAQAGPGGCGCSAEAERTQSESPGSASATRRG